MKRIITLVLILAVVLCGCDKNHKDGTTADADITPLSGGELRLFCDKPDTLNPVVTGYKSISQAMYLVYDGLFRIENDFSAVPVLAVSCTPNSNNTQYTVKLKNDVKFHDGTSFGAEDVIATMDNVRACDSKYNVNLKNIESYVAQSDGSVVFTLNKAQTNFANVLDFPILPSELSIDDYAPDNKYFVPNGTGKYKVESVDVEKLVLTKNDNYHNGRTYIDDVILSYANDRSVVKYSFEAKELDVITTDLYSWGDTSMSGDYNTLEYESNRLAFLGFNCQNTVLSDSSVRQALSYALDKQKLTSEVMYTHASVVDTPVNPNAYFSNDGYVRLPFESGKMKNMLKDSGWFDFDGDGYLDKYFDENMLSLSFNLVVNASNPTSLKLAEFVASNFKEEGVLVNLVKLDYDQYINAIGNKEFDMFLGRIDIMNDCNIDFMLESSGLQNYFAYSSVNMDDALYKVSVATDAQSIKAAYLQLENVFKSEAPFIPLYFETDAVFLSSRIKGNMNVSRTGVYTGVENIFVNYDTRKEMQ